MSPYAGRGGPPSAAPLSVILPILGAILLGGCHTAPPTIVPPTPTSTKFADLERRISARLASPALANGTWGIEVRSLTSGETLFALNPQKLLMPASTLKIVTLAVAADQLGWDYTFRTTMFTTGTVEQGVLHGDVLVVGTGDPTIDDWDGFASARFDEWAGALKRDGIHAIAGRVIGDDNAFDDEGLGSGWAWDDLANSYATSVGALQFNQNTAQLVITPSAAAPEAPRVEVVPQSARFSVLNHATTASVGQPLTVRALPRTATVELVGTIPPGSGRILRNVSVPNPTIYFANALRDGLIRNGIDIAGPAIDIDDLEAPPDRATASKRTEILSKGLDSISTTMMKLSQNLFAETLLKTIGLRASGFGTAASGRSVVDATLAKWEVPGGEVLEVDGSGLSRYNLITANALVTILNHVYHDERLRDSFIATLPLAGVDRMLAGRMKGTPAEDNARAKTGSLSNARALAGYVRTADGEPVAFAILANNYGVAPSLVDDATDAVIVALASFSRR